jgi:eukaryotic-like serine/threonine-protein kinase
MKFGQYELLERVAVGGMAEVYRGRVAGAEGFEKWVAIKRILPEFARDDRFISMMLTEARIHSALSHRNIVQIHDLGISEDGEYFIVLEYVEGHDLRAVMEAAAELGVQIPDSLALHVADELAQALHFAHELRDPDGQPLGIIHRDVSPSNVLISNAGEVKLSDFGIAKRRHDHSFVGSLKGNLAYMSPEQARRVPLDRRTDVFSLGAVLFEMLTGQKVREITDDVSGFRDVASGVVRSARALRPDLSEAFEALLARALAADPADRFPDAASFGTAIRELRRESDAPVGPADLKELIELLNPPRRARSPVERSKVIRLGPEFKMLAGPTKGAHPSVPGDAAESAAVILAPGMVPIEHVASKTNGNGGHVWADGAAARLSVPTPNPATPGSMAPTPPPPLLSASVIAKPVQEIVRQFQPARAAGSMTTARRGYAGDMQATPPPPLRDPELVTPVAARHVADRAPARPFERPNPAMDFAAPEMAMSMPTPPPNPGAFPGPAYGPHGNGIPLTPAVVVLRADAPIRRQFTMAPAPATVVISRDLRRGPWRSIAVVLVAVLAGSAAVVHYRVLPLDVAVVWFKPATLSISSDPSGADVTLDGRVLAGRTPTRVDVKRDLQDHVLELARPGSLPVRAVVRFDRTVALSQTISLPPAPPPPPPAPVAEMKPVPQAPVAQPGPPPAATKAEKKAAKLAAKKAKQEAKQAAKKPAKKKLKKKKQGKKAHQAKGGRGADSSEL